MPEFSMWGPAESGFRLAQQDSVAQFVKLAQGRHDMAVAQQQEQKTQEQQKLAAAMGQLKDGPTGSVADRIEDAASQLMKLGQPAAAAGLATKSAEIRVKDAQAGAADALATERGVKVQTELIDRASGLYANARDQTSWDAANMMFGQMFPGTENPFAGLPYNPKYVEMARGTLLKEKDRLAAIEDSKKTAIQDRLAKAREKYLGFREGILERQVADRERRTDLLEKNGGSTGRNQAVGSPTKKEVVDAGKLLESKLESPLTEADAQVAPLQIASEAKAMLKANKGLDWNTALERATTNAIKAGDFEAVSSLGGFKKETKFKGGGKTPDTALKASASTAFQVGRYYIGAGGQVAKYNGKGFEPVRAPAVGSAAGLEDDNIDEE